MLKFLKSLNFQGWLWLIFPALVVGFLVLDFSGWGDGPTEHELELESYYESGYDDGYDEGFLDGLSEGRAEGYDEGYDEGQDEGYWDGYHEGSQYGWEDNIHEVADYFAGGAVDFAIEYGGMHPEDAMIIVESGDTSHPDYEAAVDTLYYHFMYFFNCEYYN